MLVVPYTNFSVYTTSWYCLNSSFSLMLSQQAIPSTPTGSSPTVQTEEASVPAWFWPAGKEWVGAEGQPVLPHREPPKEVEGGEGGAHQIDFASAKNSLSHSAGVWCVLCVCGGGGGGGLILASGTGLAYEQSQYWTMNALSYSGVVLLWDHSNVMCG